MTFPRMGDWIEFRGRRRFVVGTYRAGLRLERVKRSRYVGQYAYYSVGAAEIASLRVVKEATARSRARARKLVEDACAPWTTVVWDGDTPTYVHDASKFPTRVHYRGPLPRR